MAWIALSGWAVNAIWHKPWADPVAALALIPLIPREGWQAMHASRLGCALMSSRSRGGNQKSQSVLRWDRESALASGLHPTTGSNSAGTPEAICRLIHERLDGAVPEADRLQFSQGLDSTAFGPHVQPINPDAVESLGKLGWRTIRSIFKPTVVP
jgi:hypothetical protein